jgi:hypothetical protein
MLLLYVYWLYVEMYSLVMLPIKNQVNFSKSADVNCRRSILPPVYLPSGFKQSILNNRKISVISTVSGGS